MKRSGASSRNRHQRHSGWSIVPAKITGTSIASQRLVSIEKNKIHASAADAQAPTTAALKCFRNVSRVSGDASRNATKQPHTNASARRSVRKCAGTPASQREVTPFWVSNTRQSPKKMLRYATARAVKLREISQTKAAGQSR